MPLLALILFVVAAVLFGVAAFGKVAYPSLVALGLCVFTVGVICQFLVRGAMVS